MRTAIALTGRVLQGRGVSGYLTVQHLRQRTGQAAGALVPIIVFTGIGTGVLYLQLIEDRAVAASGQLRSTEQQSIQTLNLVVIGMIVVFACIMLINTLVASTTYRRGEFGRLRLAGATPRQVLRMVRTEALLIVATGTVLGTMAGSVTVLPYSVVRADRWIPTFRPGSCSASSPSRSPQPWAPHWAPPAGCCAHRPSMRWHPDRHRAYGGGVHATP